LLLYCFANPTTLYPCGLVGVIGLALRPRRPVVSMCNPVSDSNWFYSRGDSHLNLAEDDQTLAGNPFLENGFPVDSSAIKLT